MNKASNILKAIIIATILIVILIFSFQNMEKVQVDFLNQKSKEIPLFIILIGVLVLGAFMGYLLGLISGSKISKKKIDNINIRANEEIAKAESKILNTKNKTIDSENNI